MFFPGPAPFALSILGQGWGVSGVANCEFWTAAALKINMSNEKNPRGPSCLGYIRDYSTQLYGDYNEINYI